MHSYDVSQISAESVFDFSQQYVPCQNSVDAYCLPMCTDQLLKVGSSSVMSWKELSWEDDTATTTTTTISSAVRQNINNIDQKRARILQSHEKICQFASRVTGLPSPSTGTKQKRRWREKQLNCIPENVQSVQCLLFYYAEWRMKKEEGNIISLNGNSIDRSAIMHSFQWFYKSSI